MSDEQGILRRLDHYADCIEKGVHVTGTQLKSLVKDIRESGLISSQQPAACPHRELCECIGACKHGMAGSGATEAAAAPQPAAVDGADVKDAEIEALRAEVAAVWNAMPSGTRYLDPPDGGDVPLHEQVRRMAADAVRAERLAEALRIAEAALADIGDADREPGDDVSWCERRAALGLRVVRDALRDHDQEVG